MKNESKNKGYLNIPRGILQHKQIPLSARIVLAEIIALSEQKGYAWASNKRLGELIGLGSSTVQKAISQLKEAGLIKSYVEENVGNHRKIYVQDLSYTLSPNWSHPISKLEPPLSKLEPPYLRFGAK